MFINCIIPHSLTILQVLSWNVSGDEEINEKSLELFTILDPKPDVLVVGFGNLQQFKPEVSTAAD